MNRLSRIQFKPSAVVVALALFIWSSVALTAQQLDPAPSAQQPDPNVRAARLSYVEGNVQVTLDDQILANPALANTPLFAGTVIATSEDGRAEIQLEDGSVARLSPNSSLKIAALKQQGAIANSELQLLSGLAYFELQGDTSSSHTVARFGQSTVTANGFTVLRISLDNPPGELAVFSGNAHLERGSALSLDLHGGESLALSETDPNQYNLAETIEPDSWDAWNADRDQQMTSEQAARTAASSNEPNSSNPAWGDLDANGSWYNVPGQGYVWSPYEAAAGDWDPYGCGNWVWTPQFGYIWVSCESWGYLPYTCGYWNYYDDFGWGWTPGYGYPWWFTGGWGSNIGTRPVRYQPPHRPRGGPVRPPRDPIRRGGVYQPNPVIAVNRIPKSPTANPVHVVGRPVTIAGSTVEPLRPLSPRPTYEHVGVNNGFVRGYQGSANPNLPRSTNPGVPRYGAPGYIPWANSGGGRPGTMPAAPGGGSYHPSAPPSRGYSGYSGGSAPSRPAGGGSSHPSGGGGGGGHVSSGGGGGGGHASGGAAPAGGHH
jgi:hypothetical protein